MRKQIREHLVHRNTVLYSWIISYLIILCLPFCISSILMQLLIQSVRQETQEAYRNELLNTQILLDEKLSEMSRMALEFSLNKEVTGWYPYPASLPRNITLFTYCSSVFRTTAFLTTI